MREPSPYQAPYPVDVDVKRRGLSSLRGVLTSDGTPVTSVAYLDEEVRPSLTLMGNLVLDVLIEMGFGNLPTPRMVREWYYPMFRT